MHFYSPPYRPVHGELLRCMSLLYLSISSSTNILEGSQKCIFPPASNVDIQCLNEISYISLNSSRACFIGRVIGFLKRASSSSTAWSLKVVVAIEDCFPCRASLTRGRVTLSFPVLCKCLDRAVRIEEQSP